MKQKRRRGFFWWLGRIVLGLLALAVLLGIGGSIYQGRASDRDRASHPPTGDLVTVNGRQMHIDCQGQGSPTVILDAGTGGWSIAWSEIVPQLSQSTRVCAYDRAGLGWSEAADDARTPQDIAADLKGVLDGANIAPPYIMTGFSYTGLSARVFSAQNPDDVVGLVLVDPTTEFDNELMGEDLDQLARSSIGAYQMLGLAARVGLVRFWNPQEMAPFAPFIPEDAAQPEVYYSFVSEPLWWQTSQKEVMARYKNETLESIRTDGVIRDIPTVVIGAESIGNNDAGFAEFQAVHKEHLREIAGRSSLGEYILAENSSHEVPRDRPDVVIAAIERVLEQARVD